MALSKVHQYELWVAAARRNGEKLTKFTCPHCETALHTLTPESGEKWDSMSECPYCRKFFMKVISTSAEGKAVVTTTAA